MIFYIKQNSTLPKLMYSISPKTFEKYSISEDVVRYGVATFSMINKDTGHYVIANSPAELIINTDPHKISKEGKYLLTYSFTEFDTSDPGVFWGEFKIDFLYLTNMGKLTLPSVEKITIVVSKSITKTTVI